MYSSCCLAIDTLGADTAACELVHGALDFAEQSENTRLVFIGTEHELRPLRGSRHKIVITDEWISQSDSLFKALRGKTRPSMRIGLELMRGGSADALVSTGNTGALMSLSRSLLSMLPGIRRPAVIKEFQGKELRFWMLDLGANLAREAKSLLDNALLGTAYAEGAGGISKPRVALLNIGAESQKGPKTVQMAASLMEQDDRVHFVGFVEADRIFDGLADVVVTDGFSGNVALKAMEGAVEMARFLLRKEADRSLAATARPSVERLLGAYNPQAYNGASFVGLDGVVVKSHGDTDRIGFAQAVQQAEHEVASQVPARVRGSFRDLACGVR